MIEMHVNQTLNSSLNLTAPLCNVCSINEIPRSENAPVKRTISCRVLHVRKEEHKRSPDLILLTSLTCENTYYHFAVSPSLPCFPESQSCACVYSMRAWVPAGGLSQHAGELTLSVDAVVFIAIWTGDGQAAGQSVPGLLFVPYKVNKHTTSITEAGAGTSGGGNDKNLSLVQL